MLEFLSFSELEQILLNNDIPVVDPNGQCISSNKQVLIPNMRRNVQPASEPTDLMFTASASSASSTSSTAAPD